MRLAKTLLRKQKGSFVVFPWDIWCGATSKGTSCDQARWKRSFFCSFDAVSSDTDAAAKMSFFQLRHNLSLSRTGPFASFRSGCVFMSRVLTFCSDTTAWMKSAGCSRTLFTECAFHWPVLLETTKLKTKCLQGRISWKEKKKQTCFVFFFRFPPLVFCRAPARLPWAKQSVQSRPNSAFIGWGTPCMLQHGIMEQDRVGSRKFRLVLRREQKTKELSLFFVKREVRHPTGDDW